MSFRSTLAPHSSSHTLLARGAGTVFVFAFAVLLSACTLVAPQAPNPVALTCNNLADISDSRFGIVNAQDSFTFASIAGAGWNQPFPGPFVWGAIQSQKKSPYDFSGSDRVVTDGGSFGLSTIGILWGYTDWDQHAYPYAEERECKGIGHADTLPQLRCRPFNDDAYAAFVTEVVERYDGDRLYDAENLCMPIMSWQVGAYPIASLSHEDSELFHGDAVDYFNVLRISFEAVKGSCPQCDVHFGTLDGSEEAYAFLDDVLRLGGAAYFDTLTVDAPSDDVESVMARYASLLDAYHFPKPLWAVISVPDDPELVPGATVRGMTRALAAGAERVFYTQMASVPDVRPSYNADALLDLSDSPNGNFAAFQLLTSRLEGFSDVEKLRDGVYAFARPGKSRLIIAWREADVTALPEGIEGILRVTALDGTMEARDVSTLILDSDPVLIE